VFTFDTPGISPHQIWMTNLGFLATKQFVANTRIQYQRPLMPYVIADGGSMSPEDTSTFFTTAFALALTADSVMQDDGPFLRAATDMGQATCDQLDRDYELEEEPLPGRATAIVRQSVDAINRTGIAGTKTSRQSPSCSM